MLTDTLAVAAHLGGALFRAAVRRVDNQTAFAVARSLGRALRRLPSEAAIWGLADGLNLGVYAEIEMTHGGSNDVN